MDTDSPPPPSLKRKVLTNLKVWIPFLTNSIDRRRQVKYAAADERYGLTWKVSLPKQCWRCQRSDGLQQRVFEGSLRAFESPTEVLGGTFAAVVLLICLSCLMTPVILLVTLTAVILIGLLVLRLKSWREELELTMWTCDEHAATVRPPEMGSVEDKLVLFLPTPELAQAAQEQILAKRRGRLGQPAYDTGPDPTAAPPPINRDEPSQPVPVYRPPPSKPADLPPIKLAGEDDE